MLQQNARALDRADPEGIGRRQARRDEVDAAIRRLKRKMGEREAIAFLSRELIKRHPEWAI